MKNETKIKSKICKQCGREFQPYTSLVQFCSPACYYEHERGKRKYNWSEDARRRREGEGNPKYRGGHYTRTSSRMMQKERLFQKNGKELILQMIEKDGYAHCQFCGKTDIFRLEKHHIIYRSEKPNHEHLHAKENILILCSRCHQLFHKEKGIRDSLVIERGLDRIFGPDVIDKTKAA